MEGEEKKNKKRKGRFHLSSMRIGGKGGNNVFSWKGKGPF